MALLTPVHSFNLLLRLLPEQRDWRRFAYLPNRHAVPDVRMLHAFRERLGVAGLRRVNEHLLESLLPEAGADSLSLALMDATDLPAACSGFKKNEPGVTRPSVQPSVPAPSRAARVVSSWATRSTRFACG